MFRASLIFFLLAIIAAIEIFGNSGILIVPGMRLDLDKYSITTAGVLFWLYFISCSSHNIL